MKGFGLIAAAALMMSASALAAPSVPKVHPQGRSAMSAVKASKASANFNSKKYVAATKKAVKKAPSMNVPGPTDATNKVITEAPAGKSAYYAKEGIAWGNYYGYFPYQVSESGCVAEIVYTDDNKVYMAPAFSEGVAQYGVSYLVGEVKDNVATFTFPQAIYYGLYYDGDGNTFMDYDYALMMEYYADEDGYEDLIPSSNQTISFNIAEDGTLTPTVKDPDTYIAAAWWFEDDKETSEYTYGGWYWALYGDNYTSLTPIKATPSVMPEGVTAEPWNVILGSVGYHSGVAVNGSDIYISGLYEGVPEGTIVGKLDGNKATFPAETFLGVDKSAMCAVYAQGAEWTEYEDPDYGMMEGLFANGKEIVFTYDADGGKLSCEGSIAFSMTPDETIALNAGLQNPVIYKSSGKEVTEISAPKIVIFEPYDEEYGASFMEFRISNVVNGTDILSADKLFFSIYMNDELFAFEPDEYFCFTKPVTEVPYKFVDNSESFAIDFDSYNQVQTVGFFVDGVSTIGVQAVYKDGDKVVKSEITTISAEEEYYDDDDDDDDAITEITADSAAAYYDLQGRRIASPRAGQLLIKQTAKGSVKVIL